MKRNTQAAQYKGPLPLVFEETTFPKVFAIGPMFCHVSVC